MSISIKKKRLTKFPEENLPLREKGKHLSMISADELISDTYAFLKTFYRGCYDAYLTRVDYQNVFICVENFALVIKGLVKAVFGRELIIIRFNFDFKNLYIDFEFDTSVVTQELREEFANLAETGGFGIEISERLARLKIKFLQNSLPYLNSISPRIVYNTLVYIFQTNQT